MRRSLFLTLFLRVTGGAGDRGDRRCFAIYPARALGAATRCLLVCCAGGVAAGGA